MGWGCPIDSFRYHPSCLTVARAETRFLGRLFRCTRRHACPDNRQPVAMGRERYVLRPRIAGRSRPASVQLSDSSSARAQGQPNVQSFLLRCFVFCEDFFDLVFQTARPQCPWSEVSLVASIYSIGHLLRCLCRRYGVQLLGQLGHCVPFNILCLARTLYKDDQLRHGQLCIGHRVRYSQ